MVLVPQLVQEGQSFGILGHEGTEMVLLFGAGLIGLLMYNWLDIRLKRTKEEHVECAREASDTSKDLTSSYTYIGMLNRKLDILREIVLTVPREVYSSNRTDGEMYDPILEAIELFGDCRGVRVGFYHHKTHKILNEVGVRDEEFIDTNPDECSYRDSTSIVHKDGYVVIRSPRRIQDISPYCVFKRNHIKAQDIDLIKALLVQALFLHISLKERKRNGH